MWLILTENVDTNSNKYQNFWPKMWLGIKVIRISSPEQKHSPFSTQLLGGIAALIITLCHRNRNEITQLWESISNFTFKLYSFHTTCVLHRRDLQMRPSNRLERENEIFLGDQSLFIIWVGWKREFLEGLGDQVVFMRKRRETSVVAKKV